MTALEYFKEKNRMNEKCALDCHSCPLSSYNNPTEKSCADVERLHPEEAIAIVEKWSKEHPRKTRAQDFFEKFPNAFKTSQGVPEVCARFIGYCKECSCGKNCIDCWNESLE